ncbi:hypothetical protein DRO26_03580 [Candidatus Bathyarchaeota archaeon]|nr:MAG: hypothetical protein DRO26_03580 [Candidatus Bathyarchaeota archaeon]
MRKMVNPEVEKILKNLQEISRLIESLRQNDLIEVYWFDACSFQNIKILTPEIYITRKKTVGYFFEFRDGYLIILSETTNGHYDGTSIHIGCIEKIIVLSHFRETSKKKLKIAYLERTPIKTLTETRKVGS